MFKRDLFYLAALGVAVLVLYGMHWAIGYQVHWVWAVCYIGCWLAFSTTKPDWPTFIFVTIFFLGAHGGLMYQNLDPPKLSNLFLTATLGVAMTLGFTTAKLRGKIR